MKAFFEFITMFSFGKIYDLISGLVKGYFIRYYLGFIEHMRSIYFMIILTAVSLFLLLSGFLLVHVALFMLLPWSLTGKLVFISVLGASYILISLMVIGYLQSRSYWLKISGAKSMIEEQARKKD